MEALRRATHGPPRRETDPSPAFGPTKGKGEPIRLATTNRHFPFSRAYPARCRVTVGGGADAPTSNAFPTDMYIMMDWEVMGSSAKPLMA